jgi:hypothetical protein
MSMLIRLPFSMNWSRSNFRSNSVNSFLRYVIAHINYFQRLDFHLLYIYIYIYIYIVDSDRDFLTILVSWLCYDITKDILFSKKRSNCEYSWRDFLTILVSWLCYDITKDILFSKKRSNCEYSWRLSFTKS